jgi:hypothetical protein
MILRRPPGDSSKATIAAGHTVKVEIGLSKAGGGLTMPRSHSLGIGTSTDFKDLKGAGGGPAPILGVLSTIFKDKTEIGKLTFSHESSVGGGSDAKSLGVSMTLTTKISTPSGPGLTGHAGDMFLSAALSVRFQPTLIVTVSDTDSCKVAVTETEQWYFASSSDQDLTQDESSSLTELVSKPIVKTPRIPDVEADTLDTLDFSDAHEEWAANPLERGVFAKASVL